ncbi:hypothetical protein LCGC14_0860840, partial [marine sediment metagenome]
MKSYTLNILWTKEGDGQPHQRKRTVSVEVPVEGDITAIQDALLSLPGWTPEASYGESRTVRLPDSLADDLNDVGILTRIIPQARAEMEAAAREKVEQKEAHHAKRRAKLEAWLDSGDPDNTPWGVDDKRVGEDRGDAVGDSGREAGEALEDQEAPVVVDRTWGPIDLDRRHSTGCGRHSGDLGGDGSGLGGRCGLA